MTLEFTKGGLTLNIICSLLLSVLRTRIAYILFLAFITIFSSCDSDEFYNTYSISDNSFGNYAISLENGGFLLTTTERHNSESAYAAVYRIDKNGDILWQQVIDQDVWDEGVQCLQRSHGGYTVLVNSGEGWFSSDIIIQINENGTLQDSYPLATSSNSIIFTSDGNYLLVGSLGPFGLSTATAQKLSQHGQDIWYYSSGDLSISRFVTVLETESEYVLLGSYSDDVNLQQWPYIVELSKDGEVISEQMLDTGAPVTPSDMCVVSDELYVLGTKYGIELSNVTLLKLSENGTIDWSLTLGAESLIEYSHAILPLEDSIMLLCSRFSENQDESSILLIRVSTSGDVVSEWEYGFGTHFSPSSIDSLNGGYMICGTETVHGEENRESRAFILTIDDAGVTEDYLLQ
ncbi:MAG: hypothetical protein KAW14_14585 [Candidatus Aegiribacteria sp.]|nr:hypothetical protein [Candidatus Aegiribacteria sp.]